MFSQNVGSGKPSASSLPRSRYRPGANTISKCPDGSAAVQGFGVSPTTPPLLNWLSTGRASTCAWDDGVPSASTTVPCTVGFAASTLHEQIRHNAPVSVRRIRAQFMSVSVNTNRAALIDYSVLMGYRRGPINTPVLPRISFAAVPWTCT